MGACQFAPLQLDPGGDVEGRDGRDRRHASARTPSQKIAHRAAVGPPRMRVSEVGREKSEEARAGAFAGRAVTTAGSTVGCAMGTRSFM